MPSMSAILMIIFFTYGLFIVNAQNTSNISIQLPSISPSYSPTISTLSPSISPVQPPTNAPISSPTNAPTFSPTQSPTFSPTRSPTFSPTRSPTFSPTRSPTPLVVLREIIYIDYNLTNITKNISIQLKDPNEQDKVEHLFEDCYITVANEVIEISDVAVTDENFHLVIHKINILPDHRINYTNYTAVIKAIIQSKDKTVRANIVYMSRSITNFVNKTQNMLRKHFNYDGLLLSISKPYQKVTIPIPTSIDPFFILIVSVSTVCTGVAITAFIYNTWIPNHRTDCANWVSVVIYNLQVVDLLTDIRLCVEMFFLVPDSINHPKRINLYIATYGTLVSTVVPFIINLVLAINIKNLAVIKKNPFAKSYFQHWLFFFVLLVVFSGGVYPTLCVMSSRLFAWEVFNCGLTHMELTKLTKIRFYVTNLLENCPQLVFSLLYINYLGTATPYSILSLMMSILQMITAFSLFIINRRPTDCHAIQYDLEMRVGCKSFADMSFTEDDDDDDEDYASTCSANDRKLKTTKRTLTCEQQTQIRLRKERKKELRRWLCSQLSLSLNRMEIGRVTLTSNGCIIRIVNYVYEKEIKAYHNATLPMLRPIIEKMTSTSSNHLVCVWTGDEKSFKKAAKNCLKDLYKKKSIEVNNGFASHFGFETDDVIVIYHKRYRYSTFHILNRDISSYEKIPTVVSDDEDVADRKLENIETNETQNSDNKEDSETQMINLTQTLADLKKHIRDILEQKDEKDVKAELIKDGYDEELIDSVLNIGKVVGPMRNNDSTNESECDLNANDTSKTDVDGTKRMDTSRYKKHGFYYFGFAF